MSETETQQSTTEQATSEVVVAPKKSLAKLYITTGVVVLVILAGAIYLLEKEGRSSTNFFGSIIANQEAKTVVAVVNGKDIINSELDTSIQQFTQMALAQGVDVTTTETKAEIRKQALEVLVNTELLKQTAVDRGIEISDEQVTERLEAIVADLGGEDVLATRMEELGISDVKLRADIKDELVIQALLDEVMAQSDTTVSEEEILAMYENAGGTEAGLPPLDEVREQVESQIINSKEQVLIDELLVELKGDASIEFVE